MAGLTMVAMALSAAQGALHIDADSWTALTAGANEVPGAESAHGARFLRVPCSNVDIPCTDENPVYRLDTDLKSSGGYRRWPLIFHAGRATCAALPPCPSYPAPFRAPVLTASRLASLSALDSPHPLAPQGWPGRYLARRGALVLASDARARVRGGRPVPSAGEGPTVPGFAGARSQTKR